MRLTRKVNWQYNGKTLHYLASSSLNEDIKRSQKLGQLEDIEDELGIDLIILFKALDKGIYCKDSGYTKNERLYHYGADKFYDFKDYGKTWALTKEELEK